MARKQRHHASEAFYHVILRGNDKQQIFFSNADYNRMCFLIQEGLERYGHRIHAFCFMSNHIHLLVQVCEVPLSKIIQNLAFRYSVFINRHYGKVGHLFQGRFKSILINESGYFLKLLRYIHMNPVRAMIVNNPSNYKWSGHNAYLGEDNISWLTTEHGLAKFSNSFETSRKLYQDYILNIVSKEELQELRENVKDVILVDDTHLQTSQVIQKSASENALKAISLQTILEAACEIFDMDIDLLVSKSQSRNISSVRAAIIMYAYEQGISLAEIAKIFQRNVSTISRSKDQHNCSNIKHQVDKLRERLNQLLPLPSSP